MAADDAGNLPGSSLATTVGCEFWDRHHAISEDADFWMAHPACRDAINRRVSGDAATYPLDHLYAAAGSPRFRRVLSLGCGTGRLERAMARLGIASEIDAIDGSSVSIKLAQSRADEEGWTNIHYRQGDLNRLRLPRRAYDAVVFHESLHHVSSVEKLLDRVRLSLNPGGLLFLDEWTGPSRTEWDDRRMSRTRTHFDSIAASWRKWPECRAPISVDDPSEAIRSSAILPTVRRLFSTILERPYGGHIVSLLLPQVARERLAAVELDRMISGWLAVEDDDLARDPRLSVYTAVLARPRTGIPLVVGRLINVTLRVALAVRYRVLPRLGLNSERSPAP